MLRPLMNFLEDKTSKHARLVLAPLADPLSRYCTEKVCTAWRESWGTHAFAMRTSHRGMSCAQAMEAYEQ